MFTVRVNYGSFRFYTHLQTVFSYLNVYFFNFGTDDNIKQ